MVEAHKHLAIVGMDVLAGSWDGLNAYNHAVYNGLQAIQLAPSLIEKVTSEEKSNLAVALLRRLIRRVQDGEVGQASTGLCVFAEQAPGVPMRLKASDLEFSGPFADLGASVDPLGDALAQARQWLDNGTVRQVVVAGSSTNQNAAAGHLEGSLLILDRAVTEIPVGEGAAALVVQEAQSNQRNGQTIYALVSPSPSGAQAGLGEIEADCVGYVELAGSQSKAAVPELVERLNRTFPGTGALPRTALGSYTSNSGVSRAGELLGVVRAALALFHRYQPGTPGWSGPVSPGNWQGGLFVPGESRPWLLDGQQERRYAVLDRQTGSLTLSEDPTQVERPEPALRELEMRLFPLAASSIDELNGMVKLLRIQLEKGGDLKALSRRWFEVYQKRPAASLALMLVGSNPEDVLKEIEFAVKGIPDAAARQGDWQTPAGSFFTPHPLGPEAEVCFVYPGAFNSYIGLGRDLFRLFPQIYGWMKPVASDLAGVFCDRYLYFPVLEPLAKSNLDALEVDLTNDAIAMMTSGMSFAVVYTHILGEVFKVKASSGLGYSLGENSMLFATGTWGEGDRASAALAQSPLFGSLLAGPLNAVRQAWGLEQESSGRSEDLWANYVLMAPPERVHAALEGEPRVYLTHVNTSRQVVIGGDKDACQRVIKSLKCMSLKAPFSYALHNEAMKSAYDDFRRLNTHPIQQWPQMRLYSAAGYDRFQADVEDLAHRVAISLCLPLDFPRLVGQAYQDGARVFIEVGAGGNCAKWIDEILRGQPGLTLSINRKGINDGEALVRALARLAAHRLPVDLAPLYI